MIQELYSSLKKLEGELYKSLDSDRRMHIRRICSDVFASAEGVLQEFELTPEQKAVLEGISKSANTIDDTVIGDFDRVKANKWLVKPYILELEKRATELGIVLPSE